MRDKGVLQLYPLFSGVFLCPQTKSSKYIARAAWAIKPWSVRSHNSTNSARQHTYVNFSLHTHARTITHAHPQMHPYREAGSILQRHKNSKQRHLYLHARTFAAHTHTYTTPARSLMHTQAHAYLLAHANSLEKRKPNYLLLFFLQTDMNEWALALKMTMDEFPVERLAVCGVCEWATSVHTQARTCTLT